MSRRKDDNRENSAGTGRRDFLRMAGLGTLAGGAALATGKSTAEAAETGAKGTGYQETDHVRTYYKLARF